MNSYGRESNLFSRRKWFDVENNQKEKLEREITSMDGDRLLNTSVDDLCTYLIDKYSIDEVPRLKREEIFVEQRETKIDVSRDAMRFIRDRSRPFYLPGTEFEFTVPFEGDGKVFEVQPTEYTLGSPKGHVVGSELHIYVRGIDQTPDAIKAEFEKTLESVENHHA